MHTHTGRESVEAAQAVAGSNTSEQTAHTDNGDRGFPLKWIEGRLYLACTLPFSL